MRININIKNKEKVDRMNKKVLKEFIKSNDENFKKAMQPVIEGWLEDEELDDKTKKKVEEALPKEEEKPKEEVKEKEEAEPKKEEVKPKEEPKIEEKQKEDEEPKVNEELKQVMETLKAQSEEIKTLKETIEKNKSFGYGSKAKQGKVEAEPQDIATRMENLNKQKS